MPFTFYFEQKEKSVDIKKLTALLKVAELATEFVQAENTARASRDKYRFAIGDYETEHGQLSGRMDAANADHAGAIEYTKAPYEAYQRDVRNKQNLKKRLTTAVQKAQSLQ